MSKEKDIVTDIFERVIEALNAHLSNDLGFEQSTIDSITAKVRAQDEPVRQHWARSDVYVPKRPPTLAEAKQKAVEEASRSGRVEEAASRHGISRATMYRLLQKNRLKRP